MSENFVGEIDMLQYGPGHKYLEKLFKPGDYLVLKVNEFGIDDQVYRGAVSAFSKRYKLKIKVNKSMPGYLRVELTEGFFYGAKSRGPAAENYPEFGTMEVDEFRDYDFVYPKVNGTHYPRGLKAAVRREMAKKKYFRYTSPASCKLRVTRIK